MVVRDGGIRHKWEIIQIYFIVLSQILWLVFLYLSSISIKIILANSSQHLPSPSRLQLPIFPKSFY